MKKKFWDKRIPSLLGILFLAISVGLVSWFGGSYTELRSKASTGETPKNTQISNITDASFTISYTTDEKTIGTVAYGEDPTFGQVGLDDRDQQIGKPSERQVHYVTIAQLKENTTYYFAIQSGATTFLNDNKPYEVTTAKKLADTSQNQGAVSGIVHLLDGSIPLEGVVYVSADNSQLLSTLFEQDGSYRLPINSLRNEELTEYINLEVGTILNLSFQDGRSQSEALVLAENANPIPLVTLSKNYDFTVDTSFANLTASESAMPTISGISPEPTSGFPLFSSQTASGPAILTPKTAEKFIDQQPLFQGTALPNATVEIVIESTEAIQTSIQADNFGNWQFRPTTALSPGEHVITVISRDAGGALQTIKRSFTVFAEGSQFTEPSVSPISSPTPIASASATPTVLPTPISLPTTTPEMPAFTPTPELAQTITPVVTAQPTSPPIPASGSTSLFIGGFLTVLSIAAGFVLFFF